MDYLFHSLYTQKITIRRLTRKERHKVQLHVIFLIIYARLQLFCSFKCIMFFTQLVFLQRSLVTATKTRKKQQTEAIKRALQQRNDKKKAERESFLITTIPITRQAAREPALDHAADDHIERKFLSSYELAQFDLLFK